MNTSPVPATLRRWLERRLLSAEPSCDSFELRYLNDGTPLGTISVPQGGQYEKVVDRLFDELQETASEHAKTSDGMHRFSVEAFGPRPERRSLGSHSFALTNSGTGVAYAKQLGAPPRVDDAIEIPTAFDALERLMPQQGIEQSGGNSSMRMQDLAALLQALHGVSGASVPPAMLKVGLDFTQGMARLLCEVVPNSLRSANATIEQLGRHLETMRERDIENHERMAEILFAHDVRKLELKTAKVKEKRKAARMDRLMNTFEAILPDIIEQFKGETPVIELLNTLDDNALAMLSQAMSPKQRKLMEAIVARAKARAEKIAKGKQKAQPAKAAGKKKGHAGA